MAATYDSVLLTWDPAWPPPGWPGWLPSGGPRGLILIGVVPYRCAGDVDTFDAEGNADGKRTDFGELLHSLYERHSSERYLRGLLVLSDGADNGTRYPALSLATKWRMLPCPIHTFAFGQT